MIITTTNSIEGRSIKKYLGLVNASLVIGTNIFSDFVASFSDFFGGMSGTYQSQLDELYDKASKLLTEKANILTANAVIGVHIDFDEISGKGKSMFMVSINGTAVSLDGGSDEQSEDMLTTVSNEAIKLELFRKRWQNRLVTNPISEEEWKVIEANPLPEFATKILAIRSNYNNFDVMTETEYTKVDQYFAKQDRNYLEDLVYENLDCRHAVKIIEQMQLFNPRKIRELFGKMKLDRIIDLIKYDRYMYSREDAEELKKLIEMFDSLPDTGEIKEEKTVFGKKYKFVCEYGHSNDADKITYCTTCGVNIKGLGKANVKRIEELREISEVLDSIFSS